MLARPQLDYPRLLLISLSFILAACAGTRTQLAPLPPGAVETEQEKQRELALVDHTRQQARLDDITYPVLAAGTSLCPRDLGLRLGLRMATVQDYDRKYRPAAARALRLSDTLAILSVTAAGPAARAGLEPGDQILTVGGKVVRSGANAAKEFAELVAAYGQVEEVPLLVQRRAQRRSASIRREQVCDYGALVYNSSELNAYADGKAIYFTSAMMRFVSDDELRVVVSHELAHNAMGHINAKRKNSLFGALLGALGDLAMASQGVNTGGYYTSEGAKAGAMTFSQDFEREADYVGIYALALAGLPIAPAPNFWRRMAVADPEQIGFAHSHPTSAERFVRLEQAIGEVDIKLASRQPLQPNLLGGPTQLPEPEPRVATAIPPRSPGLTVPGRGQTGLTPSPNIPLAAREEVKAPAQGYEDYQERLPPEELALTVSDPAILPPGLGSESGQTPEKADWLGQAHGRVYYQASCQAARELPEPIYFESEEQARQLGYSRSEVPGC